MFSTLEAKSKLSDIKDIEITRDRTEEDEKQSVLWDAQIEELGKELKKIDIISSEERALLTESRQLLDKIRALRINIKKITQPEENIIVPLLYKKLPKNLYGYIDSYIDKIKNKTIIHLTSRTDTSHKIRLEDFFRKSKIPINISTKTENNTLTDTISFSNDHYENLATWLKSSSTQFVMKYYPPLKLWGMLTTLANAIHGHVEEENDDAKESQDCKEGPFALTPLERQQIESYSHEIEKCKTQRKELKSLIASYSKFAKNTEREKLLEQQYQIQQAKKNLESPKDKALTSALKSLFSQFNETTLEARIERKEKKIVILFSPCDDLEGIKKVFDAFCSDVKIEYKKNNCMWNNEVSLTIPLCQRQQLLDGIKLIPSTKVALIDAPSRAKC
jgi:hypothetical protein